MKGISRKNTLREAKAKIENELRDAYLALTEKYAEEINKEVSCEDRLNDLQSQIEVAAEKFQDWKKSKKKKKKESIQWAQDIQSNLAQKPKKATREIKDWEALQEIRDSHRSTRVRAGEWLQEGTLVRQRSGKIPMMVVTIRNNGIVQVLDGGFMKNVRDISLRPAFDEE